MRVVRFLTFALRNILHFIMFLLAWMGFVMLWFAQGLPMNLGWFIVVTFSILVIFWWSCGINAPSAQKREE